MSPPITPFPIPPKPYDPLKLGTGAPLDLGQTGTPRVVWALNGASVAVGEITLVDGQSWPSGAIVTAQVSVYGLVWTSVTAVTLTAQGATVPINVKGYGFLALTVTTAGSGSTVALAAASGG